MSNLVPAEDIEKIVGQQRHNRVHYGRAVTAEQTLYVLHSHECLESGIDMRDCEYSTALDHGIDAAQWAGFEDEAVVLYIDHLGPGRLRPLGTPRKDSALAAKQQQGHGPPASGSWRGRERNTKFRSQS